MRTGPRSGCPANREKLRFSGVPPRNALQLNDGSRSAPDLGQFHEFTTSQTAEIRRVEAQRPTTILSPLYGCGGAMDWRSTNGHSSFTGLLQSPGAPAS